MPFKARNLEGEINNANFVFFKKMKTLSITVSRYILIVTFLLLNNSYKLFAQSDTIYIPEQFMFPEFSPGVVKMKNGEKIVLNLNYNIVTGKMVFKQKRQIFDMINYGSVDTVFINKRKFVPSGKVFYEVLVNGPVSLFIQHKGDVRTPPRPAAYGGTSEVSSTTYISNIRLGNDVFRMKNNERIVIEPKPVLWIRKDNNMHSVINERQILKIFSDKKQELKEYIRRNHLNAGNPDHMINLVNYYNGL
jgi:hypothetical protein